MASPAGNDVLQSSAFTGERKNEKGTLAAIPAAGERCPAGSPEPRVKAIHRKSILQVKTLTTINR